jgi:hypothetical protein
MTVRPFSACRQLQFCNRIRRDKNAVSGVLHNLEGNPPPGIASPIQTINDPLRQRGESSALHPSPLCGLGQPAHDDCCELP